MQSCLRLPKIAHMKRNIKLIQGPLAGISSAPFRRLAHIYGKPDFCCTEMISAKHLVNHFGNQHRYITRAPDEGKLCYQISGNDPDILAKATIKLNALGADYIDLNCGCPKPKIRKKGTGTKLLEDAKHLETLITAMKQNSDCPVSIKIRIDGNSGDQYTQSVIDAAHNANADFITIHARHWTDTYETTPHYDKLAKWVSYSDLPIIGNGDTACKASLQKLVNTGCDGIMISRAGVGQPWLFEQLRCELEGKPFTPPSIQERGQILIEHVQGLINLDGEIPACLAARKLGKYYARGTIDAEFENNIKTVNSFSHFRELVLKFFI